MKTITAQEILSELLAMQPQLTSKTPDDCRGIYGLVDHQGALRYIGSTSAESESFRKRIHHRHRTGSETHSHYFSRMYNTGRMFRLRNDAKTEADGRVAKKLRSAFIAEHCSAVWVALPDAVDIAGLEAQVIALAPREAVAWNGRSAVTYPEPIALVDALIERLALSPVKRAALARQKAQFEGRSDRAHPVPYLSCPAASLAFSRWTLRRQTVIAAASARSASPASGPTTPSKHGRHWLTRGLGCGPLLGSTESIRGWYRAHRRLTRCLRR
jgi:hypothetical protein